MAGLDHHNCIVDTAWWLRHSTLPASGSPNPSSSTSVVCCPSLRPLSSASIWSSQSLSTPSQTSIALGLSWSESLCSLVRLHDSHRKATCLYAIGWSCLHIGRCQSQGSMLFPWMCRRLHLPHRSLITIVVDPVTDFLCRRIDGRRSVVTIIIWCGVSGWNGTGNNGIVSMRIPSDLLNVVPLTAPGSFVSSYSSSKGVACFGGTWIDRSRIIAILSSDTTRMGSQELCELSSSPKPSDRYLHTMSLHRKQLIHQLYHRSCCLHRRILLWRQD